MKLCSNISFHTKSLSKAKSLFFFPEKAKYKLDHILPETVKGRGEKLFYILSFAAWKELEW